MNENNNNNKSSTTPQNEINGEQQQQQKAPYFNLGNCAPYGHLDQVAPTQPYNPHHYHHHHLFSLSQSDVVPNYGQNPNPACQFHQQHGAHSAYYASLAAAYGVTLRNTANPLHRNTNTTSARKKSKIVQWCEVCKIACDTRDVLEIHKSGKKHKENLEKLQGRSTNTNPFHSNTNGDYARKKTKVVQWCEVCNIACDTRDVLELHKLGKKHKENLEKLEGRPTNTNPFHRNANGNNARKKKKVVHVQRCEVCNIACDTKAVLDIHKSGKKHKENLEKLRGHTNSSPALVILPRPPVTPITPS